MIYYVEDDDNIRELVVYTLTKMNLPARGFSDGAAFDAAAALEMPDLVLLDIMLPNEDGMSILKRLRADKKTRDIPVIMVTAKGAEFDKVMGLDSGADDYITKPFGMAELAARVRARLRRVNQTAEAGRHVHEFGRLKLDDVAHSVTVDGENVVLTLKEYELLHFLMENRGAVYSREALLEHIWDYGYTGGTRTVDVHIQTLRSKLGPCGEMIETVRGVGYRFGGR
jgi:two-component system alkaline phosphatase synthesis response regulator PhoP